MHDCSTLESDNVRRDCRLQDVGAVQRRSGSRQYVVTHHCGGERGEVEFGPEIMIHEMRASAGTGRGGVLIAGG